MSVIATQETRIVIAEDSPVQAVVLRRALERNGYRVFWARNGSEGLEQVRSEQPHLLVSDVEMPDMDGFELCSRVKNDPRLASIPVIICTSLAEPEDIIRGMQAGADGYVTKPYDEKYLMYRVEALLKNPRTGKEMASEPISIKYAGAEHEIRASRLQILNMLLSTYENTVKQNRELVNAQMELKRLNQQLDASFKESERLLLNVLPRKVAQQLKNDGHYDPISYESVTVLFTDFMGFTKIAEKMTPSELVEQLDACFSFFDGVMESFNMEKLKTIGDSYMCAGGIPEPNKTHAVDAVLAALEIQDFMNQIKDFKRQQGMDFWELRLGIHSGPLTAGVIGSKKFAYDVWGDTVNLASRMESSGEPGRVNISFSTYQMVKDFFVCEARGAVQAKNKGLVEMYFVTGIRPELSAMNAGLAPGEKFREQYAMLQLT